MTKAYLVTLHCEKDDIPVRLFRETLFRPADEAKQTAVSFAKGLDPLRAIEVIGRVVNQTVSRPISLSVTEFDGDGDTIDREFVRSLDAELEPESQIVF